MMAGLPLRAPRPTARLRLTLLYGGLFLLSGAVLLIVTYVLFEQATATVTLPGGDTLSFEPPPSVPHPVAARGADIEKIGPAPRPPLTDSQLQWLVARSHQLHAFDMHELLIRSVIALGLMAMLSIALGWVVAGRVLRPVRTISATARQIGATNLNERLSIDGPDDEFRELAATLDDLLGRLEASFESQRRFVANASHELRTPLTLDRALLERALRKPEPTQDFWRATCERLLVSSQRQDRLIDALLTLARSEGGVGSYETFELSTVIDSVLLSPELDTGNLVLHVDAGLAPVSGDSRLVERLVRNLVDNAVRHNESSGRVEIETRTRSDRSILVVSNTGPVISASDIDRLFRPFQRLTPNRCGQGDGIGLGLSIVQAIADAHNASVTATPLLSGGLRVEVSFPLPAGRGDPRHRSGRVPALTGPRS
jgi:signal transduction histidine kinase